MPRSDQAADLYRRFEIEVRTPKRRLLVDAFLPPPESLPSAVAPPPPPAVDVTGAAAGTADRSEVRDLTPEAPPPPRRRKRAPAPAAAPARAKSLQEEIDEFMNRDQRGIAPDDDLSAFTS